MKAGIKFEGGLNSLDIAILVTGKFIDVLDGRRTQGTGIHGSTPIFVLLLQK